MPTYYKFLCNGGKGYYSRFQWLLPENGNAGKWLPEIKEKLVECVTGYHFCTKKDLRTWMKEECYEVEAAGKILECSDKIIASKCRLIRKIEHWNKITMSLLASDFAVKVLPIFESKYPEDNRPRKAILAVRAAYAGYAADAADAAGYAAYAGHAADAAGYVVYAANAANAADADVMQKWQNERILKYIENPDQKPLRLLAK